jgi:hypothetical protein
MRSKKLQRYTNRRSRRSRRPRRRRRSIRPRRRSRSIRPRRRRRSRRPRRNVLRGGMESEFLAPGSRVRLVNLKKKELNGQLGTITTSTKFVEDGRLPVLIDGKKKPIAIKIENLENESPSDTTSTMGAMGSMKSIEKKSTEEEEEGLKSADTKIIAADGVLIPITFIIPNDTYVMTIVNNEECVTITGDPENKFNMGVDFMYQHLIKHKLSIFENDNKKNVLTTHGKMLEDLFKNHCDRNIKFKLHVPGDVINEMILGFDEKRGSSGIFYFNNDIEYSGQGSLKNDDGNKIDPENDIILDLFKMENFGKGLYILLTCRNFSE